MVRSGKATRKEGRKRGEATATREQREAIKGEVERKDKESSQVSKRARNQERERERERERLKQRKSEETTSSTLFLSPAFHWKLLSSSLSFRRFPVLFVTTGSGKRLRMQELEVYSAGSPFGVVF